MAAIKKSFSVRSGLDANANSISNLGVSSASLTLSGANAVTLTTTGTTNVTLPVSGTLLYSGGALGTPASGSLANCTFPTLNQNTSGSSASCTGNAATATKLATSVNINGVAFDGSAAITVTADANTLSGTTLKSTVVTSSLTSVGTIGTGVWQGTAIADTYLSTISTASKVSNSATTATSANTASAIVARDASGNFSANVITGTATSARYADLAENYVSDQSYDYGIVLMIGGDEEVTIATEETQKLAGVVSKNPGYLMNSECEGKHVVAIALQGRTPVRVKGKVNKGDFLVSAGDGYAKATDNPRIGSIIGKSLESFDGQYGMVEAMVGRL